jgi:hypothetical protein
VSLRFFPSETRSLSLLTSLADVLREALATTSELFSAEEAGADALRERLEALELKSTDLHYALLTHLRTSFVNPLPREDLYTFSRHLARSIGFVASAGSSLPHAADRRTDRVTELLEILGRQADLGRKALAGLGRLEDLEDLWLDLLRLSSRSRRTQRAWQLDQAGESRIASVITQQVLARDLQGAADALLGFTDHLGHVLVKES